VSGDPPSTTLTYLSEKAGAGYANTPQFGSDWRTRSNPAACGWLVRRRGSGSLRLHEPVTAFPWTGSTATEACEHDRPYQRA